MQDHTHTPVDDLVLKAETLARLVRWKFVSGRFDLDRKPPVRHPKFMTAREAVGRIPDGAAVMSTGMTGTMRPAILYRAVRAAFEETGHPRGLTWITAGGAGGRGRVAGTVEEVGREGLVTRFLSGHLETARSLLELGERGVCELLVLPQGTITHLAEAQARGEDSLVSEVGVGTFMDPRVGNGSQVVAGVGPQLVEPAGDCLRYRMPRVTAACVIATAADRDGNAYMMDAPILAETREAARAARANGGVVILTVARIVPRDDAAIFLRAEEIDAVVVNPTNEMSVTVPQSRPWSALVPGGTDDVATVTRRVKALNDIMKLDPARGPIDALLARQAADLFSRVARPGSHCIVGYGLPQEVGRLVQEGGLGGDTTFLLETGVYGGTPAPGIFFGMSFNPQRLMTSAEMFHFCEEHLDVTVLGTLQVDSEGNVNVSRKAPGARQYIGPGGFLNLVASARTILFVGNFMARSKLVVIDGRLRLVEPGIPKYVERVDELTFSGKAALAAGKRVFYLTPMGAFRLTERGLELFQVAPGIDVEEDILMNCKARIVLPLGGPPAEIDRAIVTGRGFRLAWQTPIV